MDHVGVLRDDDAHAAAFGRALRMGMTLDPRSLGVIPSTKGSL